MTNSIDVQKLRQFVSYEPESGLLYWAQTCKQLSKIKPGALLGWINGEGYVEFGFQGRKLRGHRAAWALYYGYWPDGVIDHIDGNKINNRISNLRVTDRTGNSQNSLAPKGPLRLIGVCRERNGRFGARIRANGKQIRIGSFGTAEEAHAAYLEAKGRLHPMWKSGPQ